MDSALFQRSVRPIAALLLALAYCSAPIQAQTLDTLAKAELRARVESITAALDAPSYAASVPWDEFVVLAYRFAQERDPTPLEFYTLAALREHHGMDRSLVLALAMRGEGAQLDWDSCAALAEKGAQGFPAADAEVVAVARALAATPADALAMAAVSQRRTKGGAPAAMLAPVKQEADVTYQTYFGFLHAHSHLSLDANGAPEEAYRYAREEGGLDFFALTDHGIFLGIWPWERKWARLRAAADAADVPGEFAALWGFEWSNPVLGHVSVINTPAYTDTLAVFGLEDFYDWLGGYPEAFGRFNHPGDFDFIGTELKHFQRYAAAVPQMTGVEIWNGRSGFGRYHYAGGWDGAPTYLDGANLKGWRVGALGAEDNHHGAWGTLSEFRTAVLAVSLDREAIVEAYRARRFYATEDKDLFLDFRCQGYPMGARLAEEAREFTVSVRDESGDAFVEARLYRNGEELAVVSLSGSDDAALFSDTARIGTDYYYVVVRQADDNDGDGRGDEAVSSPIWFGEVTPQAPGCAAGGGESPGMGAALLVLGVLLMLRYRRPRTLGS